MSEPVTVMCVLFRPKEWAGGCTEYGPQWVEKLYRGFLRNTSREFDFVCLTDFPQSFFSGNIRAVPYEDPRNVGNWLGITEVMRPEIGNQRRVFLGLDSVIVGNVDWLLDYRESFGLSANAVERGLMPMDHVSNAVAAWDVSAGVHLWERLRDDREAVASASVASWSRGAPSEMVYWRESVSDIDVIDERHPGELLCFNRHVFPNDEQPKRGSVVYFFGAWKPHRLPDSSWIRSHWA